MPTDTNADIATDRGEPWPDPADYPVPIPLKARTSAIRLAGSGAFALLLAAMIFSLLRDNALAGQPYEGWRLWLRIAAILGIGGLGVALVFAGIKAAWSCEPIVSLDPAGLTIPNLYRKPVPWSEIAQVVHDKPRVKMFGAGRIVLGVKDGGRFERTPGDDVTPSGAPGGLDAARLPQVLDVSPEGLVARIQAYRAHFGRQTSSPHRR